MDEAICSSTYNTQKGMGVFCDNQGAIHLAKSSTFHAK